MCLYESALKAFNSLCEDGHSGFSIGMTKQILNRLIECKPLTSIEDTEDVWDNTTDFGGHRGEVANYQCKRMSSLFKYVYVDGSVKYRDVNRFYGVNLDNPNASYHSGLIDRVMEEKTETMIRLEFFISSSRMENAWRSIGISKREKRTSLKSTLLNMKYARRCMRNGWRK